jgi:hypothetical protein
VYTNNEVTERAWFNGTSSERTLFELVLDLRHEMIVGNFLLQIVHIAGTSRMGEGTDTLSRGEIHVKDFLNEFTYTVPLDWSRIQRVPSLLDRVKLWAGSDIRVATPERWFQEATQQHDFSMKISTRIWDLPPAVTIHALEEIGLGRNKRHETL